ncbi:MFS transporter [Kribbella sp. NPDC006257]|uniref:MFS transporter n=1 Tax=Kribbella sp. NPDC006257 TaxID=3156738 RepID=UPI0033B8F461
MTTPLPPATIPDRAVSRRRLLTFLGISAGNFLVLLDTSILNVALPDVQQDLQVGGALLPWAAVAYTVVFAGVLLASGAVSDRFGASRLYRYSLIAFAVLSLLCAAAPNIGLLIGGRALLGVAAAGMVPSSLALLVAMYPEPAVRAKMIGTWAAVTSSGLLAGPLLGGVLVTLGGWRLVFLVNPPIAVLSLVLVLGVANVVPPKVRPLDRPGVTLSIVLLGCLTFGLIDGGTNGWGRPTPLISLGLAVVALIALVQVERRAEHPVLPPALLARAQVRLDIIAATAATLVFYGMLFMLTLWYQRERGFSALDTGLAFVPMTLPMCVLPMVTGRLIATFGARRLIIFGLTCDVFAGLLLTRVGVHSSLLWIVVAEIALVLASTTAIPAATADMSVAAPKEYAASAQGALNASRQAGSALGVAVLGPLTSLRTAGVILAALALVAVTLSIPVRRQQQS